MTDEEYELRERACIIQFGSGVEMTSEEADTKARVQQEVQKYRDRGPGGGSVRESAIRRSNAKVRNNA